MAAKRGRPLSAETRVRRQFNELLEDIGSGRIDYSADEDAIIELAVQLASRMEILRKMLTAELAAPAPAPAAVVRLSAELRISEKELAMMFARVRRGLERTADATVERKPPKLVRIAGHGGGRRA
jgi:hypothetical protein